MKKKPLVIRDTADLAHVICSMAEMRETMKKAKGLIDEGKNAVLEYLVQQNVTSISNANVKVSVTEYEKKEFDMDSFKTEHPTLYKQYLRKTAATRFTYGVKT